jgi:ligand-binding sensor domain-containing protein
MGQVRFRPGRMPEDEIPAYSSSLNGRLWFATDTGKIYLDTATERVLMGSSGVSLLYGNATVS